MLFKEGKLLIKAEINCKLGESIGRTWVCILSIAGKAGSNPAGGVDVLLLLVICVLHIENSATSRSLVQKVMSSVCDQV